MKNTLPKTGFPGCCFLYEKQTAKMPVSAILYIAYFSGISEINNR